jgi:hypothetical protein
MEVIEKNLGKPWEWKHMSWNPNLTMEMIDKHPDKQWDWHGISCKLNMTMELIEKNLDKPWDWKYISWNPNLTMEMIERHPEKLWRWESVSINEFDFHAELKRGRKIPVISKEQREILNELAHVFDMPPNCSTVPVFRKGGYGFHESWENIESRMSRI